jgi:hypothetical protein
MSRLTAGNGAVCVLIGAALGAMAGVTPAAAQTPAQQLSQAAGDVAGAGASRFAAKDDTGATLDGLKVIQSGGRSIGVYHAPGGSSFAVHVATSPDLLTWTRRATLDSDASQATITALPNGAFLVAYEKALIADVLPLVVLPPQLATVSGLIGRVRIRLRYYRTLDALLAGRAARQFTAPRRIALTAEGTPDIRSVTLRRGTARSRIVLGLHHFADTDGDIFPDVDRQGTAVLTNFTRWQDATTPEVDQPFLQTTEVHPPYTRAPAGNLGDRDPITLDGARLALHEAQYVPGDFGSWRLFVRDAETNAVSPVHVTTPGGSRAFGNPTVTQVTSPAGRPALLITMFVFSEGAAPGESGELIFYREL